MKYTPRTYAQAYLTTIASHKPGEVNKITRNFWQLVWRHKHFNWRYQIISEIKKLWLEQHNLVEAEVASARPLAAGVALELKKTLALLADSEVEINSVIKPHLLGGVVVTMNNTRFDASLKGRLDNLYNHLAGLKS